jgi:hypothetical protein
MQACLAIVVELCHNMVILGVLLVELRIIFQVVGGPARKLLKKSLLDLGETAIAHLDVELSAQISLDIDVRMRLAPPTRKSP